MPQVDPVGAVDPVVGRWVSVLHASTQRWAPLRKGGSVAGFWLGLWHGLIAPITFVISLFSDNVNFYEVHNNGN